MARQLLWFIGCLCLPIIPLGFISGSPVLAAAAIVAAPLAIYFSLRKLVCPDCSHTVRVVGYEIKHCPKCGAGYAIDGGGH